MPCNGCITLQAAYTVNKIKLSQLKILRQPASKIENFFFDSVVLWKMLNNITKVKLMTEYVQVISFKIPFVRREKQNPPNSI